jgi:uncharacterized protein (DUF2062 family)
MTRLQRFKQILVDANDPPHRTALAFGIGVFIAFSPLLGLHWLLPLTACFVFRLNKVVTFMATYINNPWTIAPLYIFGTGLGCALLGVSPEGLSGIDWHSEGMLFYRSLFAHLRPYLWPYIVGNTLLGAVTGVASYFLLRWFLERRQVSRAPTI